MEAKFIPSLGSPKPFHSGGWGGAGRGEAGFLSSFHLRCLARAYCLSKAPCPVLTNAKHSDNRFPLRLVQGLLCMGQERPEGKSREGEQTAGRCLINGSGVSVGKCCVGTGILDMGLTTMMTHHQAMWLHGLGCEQPGPPWAGTRPTSIKPHKLADTLSAGGVHCWPLPRAGRT